MRAEGLARGQFSSLIHSMMSQYCGRKSRFHALEFAPLSDVHAGGVLLEAACPGHQGETTPQAPARPARRALPPLPRLFLTNGTPALAEKGKPPSVRSRIHSVTFWWNVRKRCFWPLEFAPAFDGPIPRTGGQKARGPRPRPNLRFPHSRTDCVQALTRGRCQRRRLRQRAGLGREG